MVVYQTLHPPSRANLTRGRRLKDYQNWLPKPSRPRANDHSILGFCFLWFSSIRFDFQSGAVFLAMCCILELESHAICCIWQSRISHLRVFVAASWKENLSFALSFATFWSLNRTLARCLQHLCFHPFSHGFQRCLDGFPSVFDGFQWFGVYGVVFYRTMTYCFQTIYLRNLRIVATHADILGDNIQQVFWNLFSNIKKELVRTPVVEKGHNFSHTHMHINLKENFRLPCNHCETQIRQIRLGQTSTNEVKNRSQHFKNKNRLDSCWKQVSTPFTTACTEFQTHMSVVSAQCRCNWNAVYSQTYNMWTTFLQPNKSQKPSETNGQKPKANKNQTETKSQKRKAKWACK